VSRITIKLDSSKVKNVGNLKSSMEDYLFDLMMEMGVEATFAKKSPTNAILVDVCVNEESEVCNVDDIVKNVKKYVGKEYGDVFSLSV